MTSNRGGLPWNRVVRYEFAYVNFQVHENIGNSLLSFLHLYLDAPWCDIRPTHAGFKHIRTKFESKKKEKWKKGVCVKGRNEPAHIV